MARAIEHNNLCRMVITGADTAPDRVVLEYRVSDGDMVEEPNRLDMESPTLTNSVSSNWVAAVSAAKTAESIS